jgi:hypothetical protein
MQIKPRASCTSRTWARSERKISAHPPARSPACLPAHPPARSGPTFPSLPVSLRKKLSCWVPSSSCCYEHKKLRARHWSYSSCQFHTFSYPSSSRFTLRRTSRVLSELYGSGKKKTQQIRVLAVESRAAEKRGEEREVGSTSSE